MYRDPFFFNPSGQDDPFQLSRFSSLNSLRNVKDRKPDKQGRLVGPAIDLEDMLLLPHAMTALTLIDDPETLAPLQEAYQNDQTIFACYSVADSDLNAPPLSYLEVGLELAVGSLINLDEGRQSVLLQARRRVNVEEIWQDGRQLTVSYTHLTLPTIYSV